MNSATTSTGSESATPTFDWPLANEAETFVRQEIAAFLDKNGFAGRLSQRMRDETGTDFFEWVDHLVLSPDRERTLEAAGFVHDPAIEDLRQRWVVHS